MFQDLLDKLDARQRKLASIGGLLLLTAALFSYVLSPRIKLYRETVENRAMLEEVASHGQAVSEQLTMLSQQVEDLQRQLHGDAANLPEEQLESFVIGRLQTISWRNNVELMSIKPTAGEDLQVFRESLFRVELLGSYFDLFDWLGELNGELGFVVIKEYEMRPAANVTTNPDLQVQLSIASYRLAGS